MTFIPRLTPSILAARAAARAALPAFARIAVLGAAWFSGAALADTLSLKITDQAGAPLANAVVMAIAPKPPPPRKPRPVAIEQKDREFLPFVTAIEVGTSVTFPNRDPLLHHVYSFSPAKVFEIKLYNGDSRSVLFDKPGPVALGCNIHDWMEAHIYVAPTPYFAKTDAQGQARLTLPAGAYTLQTWHPYQNAALPAAELKMAGPQSLAYSLAVTVPPRKVKPPNDPNQY
ncbi:MAG TPA: methylamine utilization protein [Burkholderiales bacterium]|nr:methylamine utilization protein [Burkholderiales bacterium]